MFILIKYSQQKNCYVIVNLKKAVERGSKENDKVRLKEKRDILQLGWL